MTINQLIGQLSRNCHKLTEILKFGQKANLKLLQWCLIYDAIWNHDDFAVSIYGVKVLVGSTLIGGGKFDGVVATLVIGKSIIGLRDGHHQIVWKCQLKDVVNINYKIAMITIEVSSCSQPDAESDEKLTFQFRGDQVFSFLC